MNSSYTPLVCLFLLLSGIFKTYATSFLPVFFDCPTDTLSLCVEDDGVRLPDNNKSFLGEGHPDATSCSVHVSQSIKVQPGCLGEVQYEVQLFLFDAGDPIILQSGAIAVTDSLNEAELFFDSELSADTTISQNGIPYTTGCDRHHRIKWIVTDSCGQVSVCEQMIDVYDCSRPIIIIPDDTTTIQIPHGGLINFHTVDIVMESNDDCSNDQNILLSFNEQFHQSILEYDPCNAPGFGWPYPFDYWIADAGRDNNCNGTIEWEERNVYHESFIIILLDNGVIECYDTYEIGGKIKTVKQGGIQDVSVMLQLPQHVFPTFNTDAHGDYLFSNLTNTGMYTIIPEKNDFPKLGVTTLDLVRIQKYLLGIEQFSSPYQYISADANNSQSVSAIDLIELRKLILGKYTELPNNTSWRFVDEDYVFGDITHPWPYEESITFFMDSSINDINFIGIKIGDVNSSAPFTSDNQIEIRNAKPEIFWIAEQQFYQKGDEVEIQIRASSSIDLQGFQLTISSPDLLFESISSANLTLDGSTYSNFGDRMTMSWFDENGIDLSKGDVMFTLKAIATQNGNLKTGLSINSEITEAEVYSMEDEIFKPQLLIRSDDELNSIAPAPNPWREKTTIAVNLAEDGNTEIEISDLNGRRIYSETKYMIKGNNEIVLESKNFEARGLMMYSFKNGNEVITGKMVVSE